MDTPFSPLVVIEPVLHERIWGRHNLSVWYPARAAGTEPVGEAWLTPPEAPVLVKMLFAAERLSVQVHPDDAYAAAHGLGRGKSEAWYVVEASAGAEVGVGLRAGVAWSEFASACRAGRAAELLDWLPVQEGEVVNVPAGTVHAIGGGMVLCELQQPSDTTFRLDDYGRGRPLHLDQGLAVARSTNTGPVAHGLGLHESGCLLSTPHFELWRQVLAAGARLAAGKATRWLVDIGPCEVGRRLIPRGQLAIWPANTALAVPAATTLLEIRGPEASW